MAMTSNKTEQPYLENLELPERSLKITGVDFPAQSEIDPETVEYFVDVDLDELTVFFGDKARPHTIDEADERYAIIVDDQSGRVIGVNIHRFLSDAIKKHPELIPILRHATMIAGESLEEPNAHLSEMKPDLRARVKDWIGDRIRHEERKTVFANFATLIGID